MGSPEDTPPAIDASVLETLFAMGDEGLREALSAQLQADFLRLRTALEQEDGYLVGRAAHEIKGLAATVGANRLADMARSVDAVAPGMPPVALAAVVRPLQREIDLIRDHIQAASGSDRA